LKPFCDLRNQNFDEDIFTGRFTFTKLTLQQGALASLNIPLGVRSGEIGLMSIKLPFDSVMQAFDFFQFVFSMSQKGFDKLTLEDLKPYKISVTLDMITIEVEPLSADAFAKLAAASASGASSSASGGGASSASGQQQQQSAATSNTSGGGGESDAANHLNTSATSLNRALVHQRRLNRQARWDIKLGRGVNEMVGGASVDGGGVDLLGSVVGNSGGGGSGSGGGGFCLLDALPEIIKPEEVFLRLIDLSFSRIHVRYSDAISDPQHQFKLGLILNRLHVTTCTNICCKTPPTNNTQPSSSSYSSAPFFFHKNVTWNGAYIYLYNVPDSSLIETALSLSSTTVDTTPRIINSSNESSSMAKVDIVNVEIGKAFSMQGKTDICSTINQ
jgi:hypothetical protein